METMEPLAARYNTSIKRMISWHEKELTSLLLSRLRKGQSHLLQIFCRINERGGLKEDQWKLQTGGSSSLSGQPQQPEKLGKRVIGYGGGSAACILYFPGRQPSQAAGTVVWRWLESSEWPKRSALFLILCS